MKTEIYLYDGNVLRAKFTVEEIAKPDAGETFIATKWVPDECLENDRDVELYESYSGALAAMYENALNFSLQFSNLKVYGKRKKVA